LNYLKYHERAAENLQFFLWYQDYVRRFNDMPASERALAPEWTEGHADAERKEYRQQLRARGPQNVVAQELFKNSDFEEKTTVQESVDTTGNPIPFDDPNPSGDLPRTMSSDTGRDRPISSIGGMKSFVSGYSQKAESAFEESGLNKPCKSFEICKMYLI
jgi:hypothetical protein